MMKNIDDVRDYFQEKFSEHGESSIGVDWNSAYAQETRFTQIAKVIQPEQPFTVLDYGCGYGAMADWFRAQGFAFDHYYGCDIVDDALEAARAHYQGDSKVTFSDQMETLPQVDYVVSSGIFNIKLDHDSESWTEYVLRTLDTLNAKAIRGFSSNFLTSYSDPERMAERPDLYFADPCRIFDYCRRNFAHNVALLHDYKIWDFTIIVRKEFD